MKVDLEASRSPGSLTRYLIFLVLWYRVDDYRSRKEFSGLSSLRLVFRACFLTTLSIFSSWSRVVTSVALYLLILHFQVDITVIRMMNGSRAVANGISKSNAGFASANELSNFLIESITDPIWKEFAAEETKKLYFWGLCGKLFALSKVRSYRSLFICR